jgi:hypothetical protein
MKNIVLFSKLSKVRAYQLRCSFLLTAVPLLCLVVLTALLFNFAQMNLFFLENKGMLIGEELRQAYFDQVQLELHDVIWFVVALYFLTLGISFMVMGWAVSPFVNGEKVLRQALANSDKPPAQTDWLIA